MRRAGCRRCRRCRRGSPRDPGRRAPPRGYRQDPPDARSCCNRARPPRPPGPSCPAADTACLPWFEVRWTTWPAPGGGDRVTLTSVTSTRDIDDILRRGADGGRIGPDEALLLYTEAPLHALGEAADAVRRRRYPDNVVTYLIDRNIN